MLKVLQAVKPTNNTDVLDCDAKQSKIIKDKEKKKKWRFTSVTLEFQ